MIVTTLCYIIEDGKVLMLLRNKKKDDINEGKWIGVGGKKEGNETIEECLIREVKEETNVDLIEYKKRAIIYFNSNNCESEEMHLYIGLKYDGDINYNCPEGTLKFVDIKKIFDLNLWEGDKIFLKKLFEDEEYFELELNYVDDTLNNVKYIK